ncbi:MarR family transcriptional regulator [Pigmentiphaga sp. H8]|uniref:MarR family winged helix-turn-helix transcriptional regulator n=1 Tax=Pigmentiphaga sp. H8 TaxID=2488560 RepID=UPI000F59C031|nr:MarR family winged helix-turn-helix transcriptional regulator [Pigmentiphaga sp. H8]AZG11189.1 MarR family transcriptional regulator [Pigmentiphaga sp. H8]
MAQPKSKAAPAKPASPQPQAEPASAFEGNLSYHLSILSFLLGKATAEVYGAEDLTTHQWKVLSVICSYAPMPASGIMQWVTLDKSAISRAVRKLHTAGLIERRLSDSDARFSEILPTRKGRDSYRRMAESIQRLQASVLDGLPQEKVRDMFDAFSHMEAQLRRRFGAAG